MPVIAGERVFVHARIRERDEEEVVAFEAKTGKQIWRDAYPRAPYVSAVSVGPQATPTVVLDRVYTFGITGILSCYEAATGKRRWQVDAYKTFRAPLPTFGVCCSPLVVGDRVVVSVGGQGSSVVAFDTETGEVRWKALDEPASTASPVTFVRSQKPDALPEVVFATTLRVVGLNPLDGNLAWEYPLVFQPAGTSPTPVTTGNTIITSTTTNGTVAIRVDDKESGPAPTREWQNQELSGYFSTPVMAGKDQLFLITNRLKPLPSCTLHCVDTKVGKDRWSKTGVGYFHAGLLSLEDGKILMLNDAGVLKLIEASPREYRELATAKACSATFVNPALSNGRLYVRDGKELICLQVAE
jgi:outer membrane protein assembly factor BamB